MARPERNNVDYFPFLCKEGKAMFYIEQKYGNDGYATWVKLLRQLAVNNYHYINLNDKVELMFLASKCKVSEETLKSIILDLCDLGEFNLQLWTENMIVWSDKFVEHIKDAYEKRRNKCIDFDGLLEHLSGLGVRKPSKLPLKVVINPQTKEDYTKEEEIKEKETIITEPKVSVEKEDIFYKKYVEIWFSFFEEKYQFKPAFNSANGKKIKSIIKKLENLSKEKNFEFDEENAKKSFLRLLNLAYSDEWLRNNFELSNIDSKFNSIIQKSTPNATKSNNDLLREKILRGDL